MAHTKVRTVRTLVWTVRTLVRMVQTLVRMVRTPVRASQLAARAIRTGVSTVRISVRETETALDAGASSSVCFHQEAPMTREEYEERKRALEAQHLADVALMNVAHQARMRTLEDLWRSTGAGAGQPQTPAAPAPVPKPKRERFSLL